MGEKEVAPPADAKKDQRLLSVQSSPRPSPPPAASSLALQGAQGPRWHRRPIFGDPARGTSTLRVPGGTQSMTLDAALPALSLG